MPEAAQPARVGADHHNAVLEAGRARVDELEPKLVAVLTSMLRRVGEEAARNFTRFATDHLTASGPLTGVQATSTMICVRPRAPEAEAIADPDGAPASDLHVTLAYLGEIEGSLDAVREVLAPVAAVHGPLVGVVGGYGQFRPPGCGILLPDVPGLVELRVAVTEALVQAGVAYAREHGWTPHITVDGSPEPGESEEMLDRAAGQPLHFDSLLIVRGDEEMYDLPLVGPRQLTAAGQVPPDWTPPAVGELVDADALVALFRGKTDPIRLALIQEVLGAAFGTPGMTAEEAIAYYHSPSAFGLNDALRTGKPLTVEQQSVVNALDALMTPSEKGMVLWRGVPDAKAVLGTKSLSKIEGRNFSTPGYLSTSETRETAELFAGGIAGPGDAPLVQEIRVPKGTPMLQIPAGDYGDQQEWLLPRDLRIAMGSAERYTDPYGEETIHVLSTATSHGTLSASRSGVAEGAGLSFDVANPLIDGLIAQTGQHITSIVDTTRANVMRVVGSSYDAGLSIPDTAKAIRAVMTEAAPKRAIMIARCLPGETLVDGAVVRAVTRRWFEGDLAVAVTESGREFSATSNHPMLTRRGWVGAGELREGDELIRYCWEQDAGAAGNEDVAHPPATVAEIFDAAAAVGVVERRRGGEPDFHGDGSDDDVDIASSDGVLRFGRLATLREHLAEFLFAPADEPIRAGFCPSCGGLMAVDKSLCLCGRPCSDAVFAQDTANEGIGCADADSYSVHALPGAEELADEGLVHVIAPRRGSAAVLEEVGPRLGKAPALYPGSSEASSYGTAADSEALRHLADAQADGVEFDRVIAIHSRPFVGFVYNLVTPDGYFTVNGAYTGNTEMTSAVNGASLAAAQLVGDALGKPMTKTWLTAPGAQFPRHEEYDGLDGQTVDAEATFTVGEDQLQYPGDPSGSPEEVINCRCAMTYSDGEEVDSE